MYTLHERTVRDAVEKDLAEGGDAAKCLRDYHQLLNAGRFPREHVTKFVQRYEGQQSFTLDEAYAFMHCHAMALTGQVLYHGIDAGTTPPADREHEVMNRILGDLPYPFFAAFWGGKSDDDGKLEWREPVLMHRSAAVPSGDQIVELVEVPPDRVCLEVGTTHGSRSLTHLKFQGGLARWPYGSKTIWFFKNLKPFRGGK